MTTPPDGIPLANADLLGEVDQLRADLRATRELLRMYQLRDLAATLEPPPEPLTLAYRTHAALRPVRISAPGIELTIIRDGAPRELDPVAEAEDWRLIREAMDNVRGELR